MKKFFNTIKNKLNRTAVATKLAIENRKAEGYIDTGIKIIIGVVIGGLILAGLYALFNTVVIPNMTTKVTDMFTYSGT